MVENCIANTQLNYTVKKTLVHLLRNAIPLIENRIEYSSVLNNRPVILGPDSLLSFNTGKGEVDNRGLMLRAYY